MKISELIKKIRIEHGYSYKEMADRLDFSKGMVEAMEKERSPISKNFLEAMIKKFPLYENRLLEGFIRQELPEKMDKKVIIGDFEFAEEDVQEFKFIMYNFDTQGSGRVDTEKFEEVKVMITFEGGNEILKNGFVVKVISNKAEPFFYENDRLVFLKNKFENWQSLDSKLILVKIDEVFHIKKLFFKKGEPFLYSFNERLFPEISIKDLKKIEYMGVLYKRLEQDLTKLTF